MALSHLESIWLRCAAALELPVLRGGDAYVHFDGARLHIAGDEALDEDDSLAQLILHEICHLLVQGPAMRHVVDWGLDNTGDPDAAFDAMRERAAVRLQAHLCGAFGLRPHLYPTTPERAFFFSLPDDAFGGDDEGSIALARQAATRAGKAPFRAALSTALAATSAALELPRHRSGASLDERHRCGGCAWRAESGHCRAADGRIFVAEDELACSRREAALDCLACGACCRSGYDAVPAGPRALVVRRHPAFVIARGEAYDLRRQTLHGEDRCAALEGDGPYLCALYVDRPRACADLPAGGAACLTARRRVGMSLA